MVDVILYENEIWNEERVFFDNIEELYKFDRFEEIRELNCIEQKITSFKKYPKKLEILDCTFNNIRNLKDLPTTLKKLFCSNNKIIRLFHLPKGLKILNCSDNKLTHLEDLFSVETLIPPQLEYLNCSCNNIHKLDKLPESLIELICNQNLISDLNHLPTHLIKLCCDNNINIKYPVSLRYLNNHLCADNEVYCNDFIDGKINDEELAKILGLMFVNKKQGDLCCICNQYDRTIFLGCNIKHRCCMKCFIDKYFISKNKKECFICGKPFNFWNCLFI